MSDAKNITLNGPSGDAADYVKDRFVLPHVRDAARLGLAYALAQELRPSSEATSGPAARNYNVETIDDEGLLSDLVQVMRPQEVEEAGGPYHLIEILMNRGVRSLAEDVREGRVNDIADLVASIDQG